MHPMLFYVGMLVAVSAASQDGTAPAVDVFDALRKEQVEVEVHGGDLEISATARVRLRTSPGIELVIPSGAHLRSINRPGDVQATMDMVVLHDKRVPLTDTQWSSVRLSVLSTQFASKIPRTSSRYQLQPGSPEDYLAPLIPLISRVVDNGPRQAAVWITTEDTAYDDLSRLVVAHKNKKLHSLGPYPFISEFDAIRGIVLCSEAGIDVTKRKIWAEHQSLLLATPPGCEYVAGWFSSNGVTSDRHLVAPLVDGGTGLLGAVAAFQAPPYPSGAFSDRETYTSRRSSMISLPPTLADTLVFDIVLNAPTRDTAPEQISIDHVRAGIQVYLDREWRRIKGMRPWTHHQYLRSLNDEERGRLADEVLARIGDRGIWSKSK